MIPRKQLDIGWRDLLFALGQTVHSKPRAQIEGAVEAAWRPTGDALVCLSIRSGFDLLLRAVDWPPGSEVLLSAITIPHMIELIETHGYVPVPIDLDLMTLTAHPAAIERAITPKTRGMLVAHLFGARLDLDPWLQVAQAHDLLMIEDCAQAFVGDAYRGHPEADVSCFSFGTIKTATALGGALLTIKSNALRAVIRAQRDAQPIQAAAAFRQRVIQAALLRVACSRIIFTLLAGLCALTHRDLDQALNGAVRGFSGPDFLTRIRHRPSAPLLALLLRRLRRTRATHCAQRAAVGQALVTAIAPLHPVLGAGGGEHTHWLIPALPTDVDGFIQQLRAAGFDATSGCSSLLGMRGAPRVQAAMERVVYVPAPPWLSTQDINRLANACAPHGLEGEHQEG